VLRYYRSITEAIVLHARFWRANPPHCMVYSYSIEVKKVLFYTHDISYLDNPKAYRILQYFPFLERAGCKPRVMTTKTSLPALIKEVMASDVVCLQRLLLSPYKLLLLRRFAKKILYDFDDAVMYGTRNESATRRMRFKMTVARADAAFCGNHFLLAEAKKYGKGSLYYVPTVVDTDAYPVKTYDHHLPFVVGWMGSGSTLRYIEDIKELFTTLRDNKAIAFKFVADKAPELEEKDIIFEKWEKDTEKPSLLSFDMGIMPVRDDIWSRGKCGLKLIQYMASGLPSLTHPFGVAPEMIEDGVNGFLRPDLDGWKEAIINLSKDAPLRNSMGKAARACAEERYSLKLWGPRVAEIINSL
jgi:glycosyltransferase involved in cell wall biosynthesis